MTDIEYLKKYYKGDINEAIRLLGKIPVQYIVGEVDFYGNIIKVNKSVLIPRFETELLVNKTIDYINKLFDKKVYILDIGTGSGCIDVALLKNINCNITSVDISNDALNVAKQNFILNNVDVNLIQSDIFSNVTNKYDVIISNPPYISVNEPIQDMVKNSEPSIALYADNDGLYFYEQILKDASNYLNNKYLIAFEIGYWQANSIVSMAKHYFKDSIITIEKDYSDKDRYIFIHN